MTVELLVKVDRKAIDKAIAEMNLFKNTKESIKSYNDEVKFIEAREEELKKQLNDLQQELTQNLMALETEKEVSKVIAIKKDNYNYNQDSKIIEALLEEIEEDKIELKLRYVPKYKQSLNEDMKRTNSYPVNPLVDQIKYEMLKAIADIGAEMKRQYYEVYHDVQEVYEDNKVKEFIHPKPRLDIERFTPIYGQSFPTVISKNEVFSAVSGNMPSKSKGVK